MKLFSSELSFNNLSKTIKLGLIVIKDEWIWMFTTMKFNRKIKKLEQKRIIEIHEDVKIELAREIEDVTEEHNSFRSEQINNRIKLI